MAIKSDKDWNDGLTQKELFPNHISEELEALHYFSNDPNLYIGNGGPQTSWGRFYLSCNADCVSIIFHGGYICVRTWDDLIKCLELVCKRDGVDSDDMVVLSSSSMDHPDEYTKDPEILALCEKLW